MIEEPPGLSEEGKTIATIMRHIGLVRARLLAVSQALEARALSHDLSKFSLDEFGGFVEINKVARLHKYGSPEYNESIRGNNAVGLHYSRNSHHPEHYHGGAADMDLLDFIEMVADWRAAGQTYSHTTWEEALRIQCERFHLSPEQIYLVKMIADIIKE